MTVENAETEKNELEEQQAKEVEQQEKLEEKTQEKMKKVFDDSTPESESSTSESSDEKSEQSDEKKDESTDESKAKDESTSETTDESKVKDESTSESSDEKKDESTDEKDKKPAEDENTLTQAEIRAALHNNWKQEDLDELVKQNPGLAKRTCAKLLEGTNNLSKKFAELGRKVQVDVKKPEDIKSEDEKPKPKLELKTVDVEKLRKDYGNDPIVDVVAEQQANQKILVDKLNELGSVSTSAAESEAEAKVVKAKAAEDAAISQQIDAFFKKPEVTGYKEFYGDVPKDSKNWDKLTGEQVQNRWKVTELADQILLGAEQQGISKDELSVDEAFERAHYIVTEGVREQVVRDKIKSSVKKREAGFTLKPSSSKSPISDTGKKQGRQFETDVGRHLTTVFNK